MSAKSTLLLFGASGVIGGAITKKFTSQGWSVISVLRDPEFKSLVTGAQVVSWDVMHQPMPLELSKVGSIDAICWAQGMNLNDSIEDFSLEKHRQLYEANVEYVLVALSQLIKGELLLKPARLCVISSIWQNISRQTKLSYGVTKSALQGLVLSLANDLAHQGHLVNAILPGALDTPMTRSNLSVAQIEAIEQSTGFNRLASLEDVANAAHYLCSSENTGVTGQFIKVDLGFSDVRNF